MSRWCFDLPVMFTDTGFSQVLNRRHWRGEVGAADGVWVREKTPVAGETCPWSSGTPQGDLQTDTSWHDVHHWMAAKSFSSFRVKKLSPQDPVFWKGHLNVKASWGSPFSLSQQAEPALGGILRLSGAGNLIVIAVSSDTERDRYKNGQDLRLSPEHTKPNQPTTVPMKWNNEPFSALGPFESGSLWLKSTVVKDLWRHDGINCTRILLHSVV